MASSAQRGYGYRHRELRARWAPVVATGAVRCWRCGLLIGAGQGWDLGHADGTQRRFYRGPEHHLCNRRTKARDRREGDPAPRPDRFWDDP